MFDGQVVSRSLPATGDATQEPVFIIATAIDEWGNEAADTVRVDWVPDTIPPGVTISFPSSGSAWPAGDSVLVQAVGFEPVEAQNQRGVARMRVDGVAYRPAQVQKYLQTEVEFSPTVDQGLLSVWIQPTADLMLETVWIRVTAEDGAGNMATDSVLITLTPPPPAPPPEIGALWRPTPGGGGGVLEPLASDTEYPWVRISSGGRQSGGFGRELAAHGMLGSRRPRDGPPVGGVPQSRIRREPGFFVLDRERA